MDTNLIDSIPWFAWIAIVGIFFWGLIEITKLTTGKNKELSKAVEENTLVNKKIFDRLDNIEKRIESLESALNDIPN